MKRAILGAVLALAVVIGLVAYATRPVDHAKAGYAALEAGKNPEAIDHLRLAIAAEPRDAALHYDLGIAYENAGWIDLALAEFDSAVRLEDKNPTYRAGLAQTKRTLGYRAATEKRYADAVKLYQGALTLAGNDAVTWYNLSLSLKKLSRDDEANKAMRRASELDPDHYKAPEGS